MYIYIYIYIYILYIYIYIYILVYIYIYLYIYCTHKYIVAVNLDKIIKYQITTNLSQIINK